jgi:succinate dehydrogenase/fumarate reductase flavoprotein subunit
MEKRNEVQSDVLVIGGGIAGAFAAIKAQEKGAHVVLVDKAFFGRAGVSALASGVYGAYLPGDDLEGWVKGACSTPLVNRSLAEKAILRTYDLLMDMDRWGVKWVKEGGKIVREFSGGGGLPFKTNAMMAEGGPQMMMALRNETLRQGVRVVSRVMISDLLTSDGAHPTGGSVIGALGGHTRTGESWVFKAKATVVAAGPYRFPYAPSAKGFQGMPRDASADGIAMMFRAGAHLGKFEFGGGGLRPVEFHCAPALEMLGGLGCRFVNNLGEDILASGVKQGKYAHEAVTRGRRSALGNALVREAREGRNVYLDATHFTPEQHRLVKQVVPIVITTFERAGYDMSKDVVPYCSTLAVSSGVSGGGARINGRCETSLEGLYAAGNCTDGAYISMGQALPGCSVLGAWAGESAGEFARGQKETRIDLDQVRELEKRAIEPLHRNGDVFFGDVHGKLEALLMKVIDHVLTGANLGKAVAFTEQIKEEDLPRLSAKDLHDLAKVNGLKNFIEVFEPALRVVLRRKESRGNVLREDYPETDNFEWAKFTVSKKGASGNIEIWEEPVPEDRDHLPIQRTKTMHPFFL